ncbi:MAG: hypothetical protein NC395_08890 [Prevotella sp.]|nr:hypothetical protein [Prevotella sp.]
MLNEYFAAEVWDMLCLYIGRAFVAFTQKSVILLIIQGVVIVFSAWDRNSGFFAVLAAIGVRSVYGSVSVWVNLRRMELAANRLSETKRRQFRLSVGVRRRIRLCGEMIFFPEESRAEDKYGSYRNYTVCNII